MKTPRHGKYQRNRLYIPNFTFHEAVRRAKLAAMRGDLDRAESWISFAEKIEKAGARQTMRIRAAMRDSERQAFEDRMRTRIDQRDFR